MRILRICGWDRFNEGIACLVMVVAVCFLICPICQPSPKDQSDDPPPLLSREGGGGRMTIGPKRVAGGFDGFEQANYHNWACGSGCRLILSIDPQFVNRIDPIRGDNLSVSRFVSGRRRWALHVGRLGENPFGTWGQIRS